MDNAELLSTRKDYAGIDNHRDVLEQWFSRALGQPVTLEAKPELSKRNGFSGETLFLKAIGKAGVVGDYVLRRRAAGPDVTFPAETDFSAESDVQRAVGTCARPKVSPILGVEHDASLIGEPFYVMEFVEGWVPCDNPGYQLAGPLLDFTPEQRRRMAMSGIEALADLAALDPKALGLTSLFRAEPGSSEVAWDLGYYDRYWKWAADDVKLPLVDEAFAWLKANAPHDEPLSISWGDSRYGNILFSGPEVAALIDWEMVTLGAPEKDLNYWLLCDEMHAHFISPQPLEGWPSEAELIEAYERRLGRPLDPFRMKYYRVFAGVRLTMIQTRFMNTMKRRGVFPPDAKPGMDSPVFFLLDKVFKTV